MKRIALLFAAWIAAWGLGCTGPEPGRRSQEWRALRSRDDASLVPDGGTVRFPSHSEWSRISSRKSELH